MSKRRQPKSNVKLSMAMQLAIKPLPVAEVTLQSGDAFVKALWQDAWHIHPAGLKAVTYCGLVVNGAYLDTAEQILSTNRVCIRCRERLAAARQRQAPSAVPV